MRLLFIRRTIEGTRRRRKDDIFYFGRIPPSGRHKSESSEMPPFSAHFGRHYGCETGECVTLGARIGGKRSEKLGHFLERSR